MNVRIGPCMLLGAILCFAVGFGFALVGVDKLHEALHSSATPAEITCSQLRSYRPENNGYITLTQFVPYPKGILVYELKKIHKWCVWVPVLPVDAPEEDPKYIVAVVSLSGVSDTASLLGALAQPRWTGILHSQGELGTKTADLCQRNPGIKFESCWEMCQGQEPPSLLSALAQVIGCSCLVVLAMVLAVQAALYPDPSPDPKTIPVFGVLGDALRWLHRRGFLSGRAAVLLAAVGFATVGTTGYLVFRDWNNVLRVTTEMHLAFIGALIGLGLLANCTLLAYSSRRTASTIPALYQRVQGSSIPADPQQWAVAVVVLGVILLTCAANHLYRSAISLWTYVFAVLGGAALVGGVVWLGFLGWKKQQEPAHFWNKPGR